MIKQGIDLCPLCSLTWPDPSTFDLTLQSVGERNLFIYSIVKGTEGTGNISDNMQLCLRLTEYFVFPSPATGGTQVSPCPWMGPSSIWLQDDPEILQIGGIGRRAIGAAGCVQPSQIRLVAYACQTIWLIAEIGVLPTAALLLLRPLLAAGRPPPSGGEAIYSRNGL